jgi:hypothetical protein
MAACLLALWKAWVDICDCIPWMTNVPAKYTKWLWLLAQVFSVKLWEVTRTLFEFRNVLNAMWSIVEYYEPVQDAEYSGAFLTLGCLVKTRSCEAKALNSRRRVTSVSKKKRNFHDQIRWMNVDCIHFMVVYPLPTTTPPPPSVCKGLVKNRTPRWGFRFSRRSIWRLLCSGMSHRVFW